MDIDRARTFIEIVRRGSFADAAQALNVTQTTVSARVRALEEELGRRLFVRNRSGAHPTPAGESFRRYAESLLQVWQQARQHLAVPAHARGLVSLGGELSLWDPLLLRWMTLLRERSPDLAVRVDVALPDQLGDQIRFGGLDLAVMYTPRHEAGFEIEHVFDETLILVRSANTGDIGDTGAGPPPGYIYVDWGEAFARQHAASLPGWSDCGLRVGLGPLALRYLLERGGCGYFRRGAVAPCLDSGALVRVDAAPEFAYPAFAVRAAESRNPEIGAALDALRACAPALERPNV